MAENNNQNLPEGGTNNAPAHQVQPQPKKWFGDVEPVQLSQKEIYDILAQGSVVTMEDDLREALRLEKTKTRLIPSFQRKEPEQTGLASPLEKQAVPPEKPSGFLDRQTTAAPPLSAVFKPRPMEQPAQGAPEANIGAGQPQAVQPPAPKGPSLPQGPVVPIAQQLKAVPKPAPEPELRQKPGPEIPLPEIPKPEVSTPSQVSQVDEYFNKKNRSNLKRDISRQKLEILSALRELPRKEQPEEAERTRLSRLLAKEEVILQNVVQKDKVIAEHLKALEKQEAAAESAEKKRQLEQRRWQEEKKRRLSEEERWTQEEEAEKLQIALGRAESRLEAFQKEQEKLEKKKKELDDIVAFIDLQDKKDSLIGSIEKLYQGVESITSQRETLLKQKTTLKEKLEKVLQEERKIELEASQLAQQEEQSKNPSERRKWGQEKWQAEEKRRLQEKKRWILEKELAAAQNGFNNVDKVYQSRQEEIQALEKKIEKLRPNLVLPSLKKESDGFDKAKQPTAPVGALSEPRKALFIAKTEQDKQQEESIRLQAKAREEQVLGAAVKRRMEQQKQEVVSEASKQAEEAEKAKKLQEIAKRAEIEKQNQKKELKGPVVKEELLRQLTKISPKEEAERKAFLERIAGKKQIPVPQQKKDLEGAVVFQPLSRRGSKFKKIAIRALVLVLVSVLIVAVAAGGYWVFKHQAQNEPEKVPESAAPEFVETTELPENQPIPEPERPEIVPTSSPTSSAQEAPTPVEPTPPPVLFQISGSELLSFSANEEIPLLLEASLAKTQPPGEFRRILFFDTQNQAFASLETIFLALGVAFPAGFYQDTLEPMLYIYSASNGSRLGVASKAAPGNSLIANFKVWEKTAVKDTKGLFTKLGFSASPLMTYFRSALSEEPPFRYQTFSKQDLGICYLITSDDVVFTTSWETMEKTIEALELNQ